MTEPDLKPRSRDVTDGLEKAAARGMLRAVGMGDDDFAKPQIGVASSWNEITPCNLSLDRLAKAVKNGVHAAGGYPLEFGTISVSDGIAMGHEGMHFSLVSREVIADSVETVMMAERLDGSVLLAGCDKSLPGHDDGRRAARPGQRLPVRRLDHARPGRRPRRHDHRRLRGRRRLPGRQDHPRGGRPRSSERSARARARAAGMYTANTMAAVAEAIGMSLPGSAAPPAVDRRRDGFAHRSGEAVVNLLRLGITARQVMTREAFENAITVVMALGGSTNAVLHLLAMAREADVDLTIDDFNRIGDKVPHLGDLKPFGRYVMNDVDKVGGIPVVMKALLDAGLMHGDALTVTGRTMAENLEELAPPGLDDDVLRSLDRPIHKTGGLTILKGSLAPEGAVVKTAGFDDSTFSRTARVFDGERAAMDALEAGAITAGRRRRDPLRGPQGRARHARDAGDHRRDQGRRPRQGRPADHRRPVLRRYDGSLRRPHRPRGRRRRARSRSCATATGSPSTSRTGRSTSSEDDDWESRRDGWEPLPPKYTRGVLAKYAKIVQSAAHGAVCG